MRDHAIDLKPPVGKAACLELFERFVFRSLTVGERRFRDHGWRELTGQ
jgi:hypothetical protein